MVKLDVQPGEEDELAVRRQAMMQGEKVAADIREARDHLGGDAAILPMLLAGVSPIAAPHVAGAGADRA